jgi:hypothetical protein
MARTPPPLPEVNLTGSGYTVKFRPIGPMIANEISKAARKTIVEPTPPRNTVTGLDGKERQEENTADPDYQVALQEYYQTLGLEITDRLMQYIARSSIEVEVDTEAVQRVRDGLTAAGVEPPTDDREVFLKFVLIGSQEDLDTLRNAVMRRSQPTEEAIQEKAADFPGDVPGS